MANIKCVMFDFGRVLANFDHWKTCRSLAQFSPLNAEEIYRAIFGGKLEKKYDSGQLSSMEFYRAVRKKIRLDADAIGFVRFEQIWGDIFSDNPGVAELLSAMKQNLKRLVISNTNIGHWKYISQMPIMEKFFMDEKQLILSFQQFRRKPDYGLFLEALARGGCVPSEAIYIDDVEQYTSAADWLGINVISYNSEKQPAAALKDMLSPYDVFEKK